MRLDENYYEELTAKTFDELVYRRSSDSSVFVMFYSPGCAHCRAWLPTWYELAIKMQTDGDVRIAAVSRSYCQQNSSTVELGGSGVVSGTTLRALVQAKKNKNRVER